MRAAKRFTVNFLVNAPESDQRSLLVCLAAIEYSECFMSRSMENREYPDYVAIENQKDLL